MRLSALVLSALAGLTIALPDAHLAERVGHLRLSTTRVEVQILTSGRNRPTFRRLSARKSVLLAFSVLVARKPVRTSRFCNQMCDTSCCPGPFKNFCTSACRGACAASAQLGENVVKEQVA
ncbi:hypothetical protein K469DRAFT_682842 [Zopfia rhizophila CBS 207.26]|uniref:Uncharacterized protein n=1 Tax=Zopfia rhizophila CBS 207.26 TaxID=1314779 RepID=A0A6A6DCM8_9PEZI|nr:hypothetical protein K469DRAFT_682842 [Zopfia rhizophila CBS 207.26]